MMKYFFLAISFICAGWIVVPLNKACAKQQYSDAKTSSTSSHVESRASAMMHANEKNKCNKMYYHYLPGMVDYCQGLNEWKNGNYHGGLQLLKASAAWGSKNAQYSLGLIYYNGHHVHVDRALGLAWLKLANERHNDPHIDRMTRSAMQWANSAQRHHAQQLFQQMRKRYGDKVAAKRAWQHLQHAKKYMAIETIDGAGGNGSTSCIMPSGSGGQIINGRNTALRLPHANEGSADGLETQPPSNSSGSLYTGSCITPKEINDKVYQLANIYFQGWMGTVNVGPIDPVSSTSPND